MNDQQFHVEDHVPHLLERLDEVIDVAKAYGYALSVHDPDEVSVARAKLNLFKSVFITECFGGNYNPPKGISNTLPNSIQRIDDVPYLDGNGLPVICLDEFENLSKGEMRLIFRRMGFSNALTETLLNRAFPAQTRTPEDIQKQWEESQK